MELGPTLQIIAAAIYILFLVLFFYSLYWLYRDLVKREMKKSKAIFISILAGLIIWPLGLIIWTAMRTNNQKFD